MVEEKKEMSVRSEQDQKWRKIKNDFVSMTSLHGLQRAGDNTGRISEFRRCVWALFIAIGLGAIIVITCDQITEYQKHPTSTKTNIIYSKKPLQFPAVTICSLNRFFYEDRMTEEDVKLINAYDIAEMSFSQEIEFEKIEDETLFLFTSGKHLALKEVEKLHQDYHGCNNISSHCIEPSCDKSIFSVLETLQDLRCHRIHKTGVQKVFDNFSFNITKSLIFCKFGNGARKCTVDNFKPVYSTRHGVCWTFNGVEKDTWRQENDGINGGLHLELYNPQGNFMSKMIQTVPIGAGLKVILHETSEPPRVDESGFFIGPGFHSFAQIEMIQEEFEKPPWGECQNSEMDGDGNYSRTAAQNKCLQRLSMGRCNCTSPTNADKEHANICSPSQLVFCLFQVKWNISIDDADVLETDDWESCSLPPACKRTNYKSSLSSVVWPSVPDLKSYPNILNITAETLRQDYLKLDIYFPVLKYQTVKEVTLVYFTNLLSKFGGTMGLFLGASILTVIELMELAFLYCVRKLSHHTQQIRSWPSMASFASVTDIKQATGTRNSK